jgi:hypothetical protein
MIDFNWDEGELGVYVPHAGDLALVEGAVCDRRGDMTGEYRLASQVRLRQGETVRVGDAPLPGTRRGQILRDDEARAYVAHLARLETAGPQVAANDQQERLATADRTNGRGHLWTV